MARKHTEIEKDIKATERLIAPLQKRLSALNKELHESLLAECDIKPGDVVMTKRPGQSSDNEPEEAIVREVDIQFAGREKPWLVVSFRKKDGQWADRRSNTYSYWEKKG